MGDFYNDHPMPQELVAEISAQFDVNEFPYGAVVYPCGCWKAQRADQSHHWYLCDGHDSWLQGFLVAKAGQ